MAIVFEKQDAYVNVNRVTSKISKKRGQEYFGGISIIGVLCDNHLFYPRGILWSGNRIISYSCEVAQRKNNTTNINESFEEIPKLNYFKIMYPKRYIKPLSKCIPYFIVAKLTDHVNLENTKFTVRDALLKIKIDVLFNDEELAPLLLDVDLRNVQNILVNVGGHPFGVLYINPLVIP